MSIITSAETWTTVRTGSALHRFVMWRKRHHDAETKDRITSHLLTLSSLRRRLILDQLFVLIYVIGTIPGLIKRWQNLLKNKQTVTKQTLCLPLRDETHQRCFHLTLFCVITNAILLKSSIWFHYIRDVHLCHHITAWCLYLYSKHSKIRVCTKVRAQRAWRQQFMVL